MLLSSENYSEAGMYNIASHECMEELASIMDGAAESSYKRVKGRSHSVDESISAHS